VIPRRLTNTCTTTCTWRWTRWRTSISWWRAFTNKSLRRLTRKCSYLFKTRCAKNRLSGSPRLQHMKSDWHKDWREKLLPRLMYPRRNQRIDKSAQPLLDYDVHHQNLLYKVLGNPSIITLHQLDHSLFFYLRNDSIFNICPKFFLRLSALQTGCILFTSHVPQLWQLEQFWLMSWNGAKNEPRMGVANHDINAVKFWKSDAGLLGCTAAL